MSLILNRKYYYVKKNDFHWLTVLNVGLNVDIMSLSCLFGSKVHYEFEKKIESYEK